MPPLPDRAPPVTLAPVTATLPAWLPGPDAVPPWALEIAFLCYAVFVTLMVLHERRRPTATLSWILSLVFVPVIGLLAYWAFGRRRVSRHRRRRRRQGVRAQDDTRDVANVDLLPKGLSDVQLGLVRLALRTAAAPLRRADTLDILSSPSQAWRAMRDAIVAAQSHVHLEFYIWKDDDTGRALTALLTERARAGVRVRVLYDHVGSLGLPREHFAALLRAGGEVGVYGRLHLPLPTALPPVNFRNHRKLVVVDGDIGFVGGVNVGDEYLAGTERDGATWRDLQLRLTGDAVIGLQATFLDDWLQATGRVLDLAGQPPAGSEGRDGRLPALPHAGPRMPGSRRRHRRRLPQDAHPFHPRPETPARSRGPLMQIIPSGPDTRVADTIALQTHAALAAARRRAWITTPYFIPDDALTLVLRTAALRGVDVRILVPAPEHNDQRMVAFASRSYYDELIEAGCRIFEYQPGMLHAKALVIDADVCAVGSANMDVRSFYLNYEITAMIYAREPTELLARVFEHDLTHAREVDANERSNISLTRHLVEDVARVLSPLM